MNLQEVGTRLDGLKEQIDGFQAAQLTDEDLDKFREEVTAELDGMKTTLKTVDEWYQETRTKLADRSSVGYDGVTPMLAAIPEDQRHVIARAKIHGDSTSKASATPFQKICAEDPVSAAGIALWLQNQCASMLHSLQGAPDKAREALEARDKILEGMGNQIVIHAAQGETTTGTGVETILTPVESMIARQIQDNSLIRQIARVMPMTAKTHQIPTLDTDVIAYFAAESGTITDSMSATNWSQGALTAKKLAGLATLSNEIIQDNAVGLVDFLFTAISEQIARLEDKEAMEGTGTNWTGVAGATGINAIEATTDGSEITYATLVKQIYTAGDVETRGPAAAFVMAPLGASKCVGLADTNGQPIFQRPNANASTTMPRGFRGDLLGYPLYTHSGILTNRTKGTGTALTNIYFGNFEKLIIGDLLGLSFLTDPYGRMDTDEVRIRVTKRTACLVSVPKSFTVAKDIITT